MISRIGSEGGNVHPPKRNHNSNQSYNFPFQLEIEKFANFVSPYRRYDCIELIPIENKTSGYVTGKWLAIDCSYII